MEKTFITLLIAGILFLQSCDEKKQQTKGSNTPSIKNQLFTNTNTMQPMRNGKNLK
ncbi:hypothetical protein SAMN04489797_1502 [Winogradskyella sediminis]|uniref:Lipoprotein n=1 Tax=Winogradskyella sediminis TaxID=1382466 RepID=A0A1H1RU76_9FLAO|nr:hypothetical protein SAMN04489797_1502 [Winogradskyella sediminis]